MMLERWAKDGTMAVISNGTLLSFFSFFFFLAHFSYLCLFFLPLYFLVKKKQQTNKIIHQTRQ
jgi:hypothetical protein